MFNKVKQFFWSHAGSNRLQQSCQFAPPTSRLQLQQKVAQTIFFYKKGKVLAVGDCKTFLFFNLEKFYSCH